MVVELVAVLIVAVFVGMFVIKGVNKLAHIGMYLLIGLLVLFLIQLLLGL